MNWKPDATWALRILENHRREDPVNVEMAIEHACEVLRREIERSSESTGDPTYDQDEILVDALKQC